MDFFNDVETFKLALENATNHIIFTDIEGVIVYANRGAEIVTGYSKEEMIGKTPRLWGGQMGKEYYKKLWTIIKDEKRPFKGEIRNVRKNGETYYALLDISPIINKERELVGFIAAEEDITRIKNLTTELAEQRSFLRMVIDTEPHLLFAKDWDGKFTLANKAVAAVYGTTPDKLLGKSDADFNPNKGEVEHFLKDDREVMTSEKPKLIAEEPVTNAKSGITRWYQTIKIPLILANKPKQILGVATDITDRKRYEEIIEVEKKKDDVILDSIGEGLIVTDKDGAITLMNQMAEKMIGWKLEELKGKKMVDYIHITDEAGIAIDPEKRALARVMKTGKTIKIQSHYYIRKNKTKFPIAAVITPIVINGKIIGTIEVFRDITRDLEINRSKTEFVSIAAHQLRSPLTSIGWHSELLLSDKGLSPEKKAAYLAEIKLANHRMVQLVDALLHVSRIELGTFTVKPEKTDFIKIISEVIKEVNSDTIKNKLTIKREFQKSEILGMTDPNLFRIIIQNLLTNAIKYSYPKMTLRIVVKEDDNSNLTVSVINNGIGIDKEDRDKIFTKFFRSEKAKLLDIQGNGLGLYIIKSILDRMKGKIWFQSKDNLTEFRVTLKIKS